jgi:putative hydrolase of the HAD superfamily
MSIDIQRVDAVTLDFYNTLVFHGQRSGRGTVLMEYLASRGLESDPWEHQVLYDLFKDHAKEYSTEFNAQQKRAYLGRLTERLFERLKVRVPPGAAADHAHEVWQILGPSSLRVHAEVPHVLKILKGAGYPLAIVSNWQCGLTHFCKELGIASGVDQIVASAEIGVAKPDPGIFLEVCERIRVDCTRVLHVGDSLVDDVEGGRNVGMQVVLVQRNGEARLSDALTIQTLDTLLDILQLGKA